VGRSAGPVRAPLVDLTTEEEALLAALIERTKETRRSRSAIVAPNFDGRDTRTPADAQREGERRTDPWEERREPRRRLH
jgi:hypothetical protein